MACKKRTPFLSALAHADPASHAHSSPGLTHFRRPQKSGSLRVGTRHQILARDGFGGSPQSAGSIEGHQGPLPVESSKIRRNHIEVLFVERYEGTPKNRFSSEYCCVRNDLWFGVRDREDSGEMMSLIQSPSPLINTAPLASPELGRPSHGPLPASEKQHSAV
ncbi:hypothetical protein CDAR_613221 [Caerostris darwini]|uniref:Uncharacterized protein n=1 Tax=Caerostris darwini TaxID=1538125 RepID=A0AAV4UKS3_9ARAC|nr:hypothetical protein CDAR_613221 [Caerostris darwini]